VAFTGGTDENLMSGSTPDLSTFVVSVGDGFEGIGSIKTDKCRVDQGLDIAAFFDLFQQVRGQSLRQPIEHAPLRSLTNPDPLQQLLESRIGTQRVKAWSQ